MFINEEEEYLSSSSFEFETLLIHSDRHMQKSIPDVAPPMHMTTTYAMPNEDHLVYSRAHHPTRHRLEKVLGDMEGNGAYATVYSTGLASVASLIHHVKPNKIFIAKREGYFGCQDVMNSFKHLIECYWENREDKKAPFELVDLDLLDQFIAENEMSAEDEKNKSSGGGGGGSPSVITFENGRQSRYLIWLETPKNPSCILEDIEAYSRKAKKIGALVVVDSTFATPILQKPLELGADFVIHSATKFLSGHSDVLAGVIVTRSEETSKKLHKEQSVMGNVLGNMETWLLLRSVRTLQIRVNQQSHNAMVLAEWLSSQVNNSETKKRITKVWYPALKSSEYYDLCVRQMGGKGPGMIGVELDTPENAQKLPSLLKLFTPAVSLGGYESLIDYRYKWDKTVSPLLLRLSIGLENVNDLIKDFQQGIKKLD